jgi:hypothetical protein
MNSIPNTPGCSGKSAGWLHISGVEKIQRCFPRIPGKFSMLINSHGLLHAKPVSSYVGFFHGLDDRTLLHQGAHEERLATGEERR